jgi:hypothetical protein
MGYELLRNGSLVVSTTNNPGQVMTINVIASGNYTGKVNCDNTYGTDTRNICLEEDPNDPMVNNQTGNYVSGGFLEIPCTYRTPTTPTPTSQYL